MINCLSIIRKRNIASLTLYTNNFTIILEVDVSFKQAQKRIMYFFSTCLKKSIRFAVWLYFNFTKKEDEKKTGLFWQWQHRIMTDLIYDLRPPQKSERNYQLDVFLTRKCILILVKTRYWEAERSTMAQESSNVPEGCYHYINTAPMWPCRGNNTNS